MTMDTLEGRVGVITGAANGIGRATALALAERHVRLVLADLDADGLSAVANQVSDNGGKAVAVPCDVAEDSAFDTLHKVARERFGGVHIVMNNVGVIASGRPEDIPVAEWQRILNINLLSVARSINVFVPDLVAQGHGHIVNTASFAGLYPYAYDRLPYAASKAAMIAISEGLALYLRPKGIGITCLCPGPVLTQIGKTIKTWGEPVTLRGPGAQFPMLEAREVGEMVVSAILNNTFFLPTHPNVSEMLIARAQDPDGFLARQIEAITANP